MSLARLEKELKYINDALPEILEAELHVKFVHDYVFDPKELQEALEKAERRIKREKKQKEKKD